MTKRSDEELTNLVVALEARLGRYPTEEEVINFINGDEETKNAIWNQLWKNSSERG